ncbi:dTDP-4-dehydrorhamnose reductase [Methylobacillus flagellatus]|uniref:dTDP-4-dehydrorhamnose reductase n=1 Tax=Methylobacillus flagellatus TaxID=405 RepID=UPI0010F74C75|nr:dTDP-4-dehydrorhamnose reductase [Methylobacillus flagellatus]
MSAPQAVRILLTGAQGQLGRQLQSDLAMLGEVHAFQHAQLDLTDSAAIRACIKRLQPTVIVNAAAYTAVDKAETERDLAWAVNATAPGVLAQAATELGALLVHYSTDYVFDGKQDYAYVETDSTGPLNVYGASKLAGEQAIQAAGGDHLILRTSWVYGPVGQNFLHTILRLARAREQLNVVADQIGAPTSTLAIGAATVELLRQPWHSSHSGIYHLTCAGVTSWHGYARAIVTHYASWHGWPALKLKPEAILPIAARDYPVAAQRPHNSCLDNSKLRQCFDLALPDWQQALQEVMSRLSLDTAP